MFIPLRKRLYIVTVTVFKEYLIVTVTIFKKYLIVTLKKLKFYKNSPTPSKELLSAAPKLPKFCLLVEGNPDSLGEPIGCNSATLVTKLSLLGWDSRSKMST